MYHEGWIDEEAWPLVHNYPVPWWVIFKFNQFFSELMLFFIQGIIFLKWQSLNAIKNLLAPTLMNCTYQYNKFVPYTSSRYPVVCFLLQILPLLLCKNKIILFPVASSFRLLNFYFFFWKVCIKSSAEPKKFHISNPFFTLVLELSELLDILDVWS